MLFVVIILLIVVIFIFPDLQATYYFQRFKAASRAGNIDESREWFQKSINVRPKSKDSFVGFVEGLMQSQDRREQGKQILENLPLTELEKDRIADSVRRAIKY